MSKSISVKIDLSSGDLEPVTTLETYVPWNQIAFAANLELHLDNLCVTVNEHQLDLIRYVKARLTIRDSVPTNNAEEKRFNCALTEFIPRAEDIVKVDGKAIVQLKRLGKLICFAMTKEES